MKTCHRQQTKKTQLLSHKPSSYVLPQQAVSNSTMTAIKATRASPFASSAASSSMRRTKSRFLKCGLYVFAIFAYTRWSGQVLISIPAASESSLTAASQAPRPLTLEQTKQKRLFVHIGKAGGSSILIMVQKSAAKCQELSTANSLAKTKIDGADDIIAIKDQTCAIAQIPTQRVHLKSGQDKYSQYQQFLVNVRNPVDRLISWYNYELQSYDKEPRWQQGGSASINFERLKACFPQGIGQIIQEGLNGRAGDSASTSSELSFPECQQLAKDCLKGDIMCFGHNFYNYEVYAEDLLRWKQEQQTPHKDIRIDVIRSEYSMSDFETIVDLWTMPLRQQNQFNSIPTKPYNLTSYVRGLYGRVRTIEQYQPKKVDISGHKGDGSPKKVSTSPPINKRVSQQAVATLCRFLCIELITYKHLLKAADNLSPLDVERSFQELDERCELNVDQICGTNWEYRNVKQQKKVFEMPW
jgi:hypothetical protein